MSITCTSFRIVDHEKDAFRIKITGQFTGAESSALREEVNKCETNKYELIYIDATDTTDIDLSGINEIIHSHYTLDKVAKEVVFLYQKSSPIETWVENTGLDKFMATAIVPADE